MRGRSEGGGRVREGEGKIGANKEGRSEGGRRGVSETGR